MNYSKIINPDTGRNVKVTSKLGKQILNNYQRMIVNQSGGTSSIQKAIAVLLLTRQYNSLYTEEVDVLNRIKHSGDIYDPKMDNEFIDFKNEDSYSAMLILKDCVVEILCNINRKPHEFDYSEAREQETRPIREDIAIRNIRLFNRMDLHNIPEKSSVGTVDWNNYEIKLLRMLEMADKSEIMSRIMIRWVNGDNGPGSQLITRARINRDLKDWSIRVADSRRTKGNPTKIKVHQLPYSIDPHTGMLVELDAPFLDDVGSPSELRKTRHVRIDQHRGDIAGIVAPLHQAAILQSGDQPLMSAIQLRLDSEGDKSYDDSIDYDVDSTPATIGPSHLHDQIELKDQKILELQKQIEDMKLQLSQPTSPAGQDADQSIYKINPASKAVYEYIQLGNIIEFEMRLQQLENKIMENSPNVHLMKEVIENTYGISIDLHSRTYNLKS